MNKFEQEKEALFRARFDYHRQFDYNDKVTSEYDRQVYHPAREDLQGRCEVATGHSPERTHYDNSKGIRFEYCMWCAAPTANFRI